MKPALIRFLLVSLLAAPALPQSSRTAAATAPAQPKPGARAAQPAWQRIPIPALPAFHPQQPSRVELANGMVLLLQVDHELPLIEGTISIRGGSVLEPAEKTGLVNLYAQAWRTGGTTTQSGDQLDDFLEARAAKVESSGGLESTALSWSCLKSDFKDVFPIVLDLLRHPEFRQDKISLAQRQLDTAISRRNDNPGAIAGREAAVLGYGSRSPYARMPQYYTVAAVTREDLVDWHNRFVYPNNIIVGVSGDFDPAAMEASLRQAFADWPRGPQAPSQAEAAINPAAPGIYFIQKEDVNQSNVHMVALGMKRNNPDYYAVTVMNQVLGGGFSGRLMNNLRTVAGLAYDVHGGMGAAYDHPGLFQLVMETKSGSTARAIDGLYGQLDDLEKNPATEAELTRAKDSILNSFIFEFDDKEKVLDERMLYEFFGYPPDFLERFRAGIEQVTAADVARVARKYLPHRDQLAVLVLGKAADFDRPLSTFGKVIPVDISIPEHPPGAAAESAPAASNPAGRALAAKVAAALGGAEKLAEVKAVKQSMDSLRTTPQGQIPLSVEQMVVYPDRAWVQMQLAGQTITTVITPAMAVMKTPDGDQPLPAEMHAANLKNLRRDLIYVAQHAADPQFDFAAGDTEKVNGAEATALNINAQGVTLKWLVEPASGRVLRAQFETNSMQGPVQRQVDYSDWRAVSGLTLPFTRTVSENGEVVSQDTVKEIELNPAIDPALFEAAIAGGGKR